MKTKTFCSIVAMACYSAAASSLLAQVVDFNSLPATVQDAINSRRGPAGIASIERVDRAGTPVYDVRLTRTGPNSEFYVTDLGAVLTGSQIIAANLPPGVTQRREVLFDMLPPVVQNTIRAELGNVSMPNAEMITVNGQTSYVVPSRAGDRLVELWIDPAGNILTFSPPRVLLSNTASIRPDQLPAAVQDTLRTYVAGAPIVGVVEGTLRGQTAYDATINRNGRNIDLRMAQDGSLVRDAVNDRYLAETGQLTREALAATAPPRIPLSEPVSVSFNQLPMPVLSAVQRYAGADYIEHIDRGIANGQTQYEVLFRHNGADVPLRIVQDGTLVPDRVNELFLTQSGQSISSALGQAPGSQIGAGSGFSR